MKKIIERAPAKINLSLHVLEKDEKGYHNLQSIMHSVDSLADTIEVSDTAQDSWVLERVDDSGKSLDAWPIQQDICYKTFQIFCENMRISLRAHIKLIKRIPYSAGLGGGSSDAAALLRALNAYTGSHLGTNDLCAMAASLGADVPFCVEGGCALCEGYGEKITKIPLLPAFVSEFSFFNGKLSTADMYRRLDEVHTPSPAFAQKMTRGMLDGIVEQDWEKITAHFYNDFEKVGFLLFPFVQEQKKKYQREGYAALMSGSGPTVFALKPQ